MWFIVVTTGDSPFSSQQQRGFAVPLTAKPFGAAAMRGVSISLPASFAEQPGIQLLHGPGANTV